MFIQPEDTPLYKNYLLLEQHYEQQFMEGHRQDVLAGAPKRILRFGKYLLISDKVTKAFTFQDALKNNLIPPQSLEILTGLLSVGFIFDKYLLYGDIISGKLLVGQVAIGKDPTNTQCAFATKLGQAAQGGPRIYYVDRWELTRDVYKKYGGTQTLTIDQILKQIVRGKYYILDDGTVEVNGDVTIRTIVTRLDTTTLDHIPVIFRKVDGNFRMWSDKVTSLFGLPPELSGYLRISSVLLKNLKYCPKQIGSFLHLSGMSKTFSLEGIADKIKGPLYIESCHFDIDKEFTKVSIAERVSTIYIDTHSIEIKPQWTKAYRDEIEKGNKASGLDINIEESDSSIIEESIEQELSEPEEIFGPFKILERDIGLDGIPTYKLCYNKKTLPDPIVIRWGKQNDPEFSKPENKQELANVASHNTKGIGVWIKNSRDGKWESCGYWLNNEIIAASDDFKQFQIKLKEYLERIGNQQSKLDTNFEESRDSSRYVKSNVEKVTSNDESVCFRHEYQRRWYRLLWFKKGSISASTDTRNTLFTSEIGVLHNTQGPSILYFPDQTQVVVNPISVANGSPNCERYYYLNGIYVGMDPKKWRQAVKQYKALQQGSKRAGMDIDIE